MTLFPLTSWQARTLARTVERLLTEWQDENS
jgi:hypothetical protein